MQASSETNILATCLSLLRIHYTLKNKRSKENRKYIQQYKSKIAVVYQLIGT